MSEDNTGQEYTDYDPPTFGFLDQKAWQVLDDHIDIIVRTRQGAVSAKDLHELYRKPGTDEFEVTIKTVYRWLEKLEKHGILTMIGYRRTDRIPERLYHRTASIFFPEPVENARNWDRHKGRDYTDRLGQLIGGVLGTDIDLDSFYSLFKEYSVSMHNVLSDVLTSVEQNEELTRFYRTTDIDEINEFNKYLSTMLLLTRHPDLVSRLQDLMGAGSR